MVATALKTSILAARSRRRNKQLPAMQPHRLAPGPGEVGTPPEPGAAKATLKVAGSFRFLEGTFDLGAMEKSKLLNPGGARWFLSVWQTPEEQVSLEVHPDRDFEFELPLAAGAPRSTKLELGVYIRDQETGLTKNFPVDSCAVLTQSLSSLGGTSAGLGGDPSGSQPGEVTVPMTDPFSDNVAVLKLRGLGPVTVPLRASPMERLPEFVAGLRSMTEGILADSAEHSCRVPKAVKPFLPGTTSLSFGGLPQLGTGGVDMHYGVLSHFMHGLDRRLPKPLLVHYLAHAVFQSGMTLQQINALPDLPFVQEAGKVLWGLTLSADGCPYQRDCTVTLGATMSKGFVLSPVVTENIGLPFSESSFLGRAKPGAVQQLLGLFQCKSVPDLYALAQRTPMVQTCLALVQDDCETSATAGMLAVGSVERHSWEPDAIARELDECKSTSGLKPGCVDLASKFFKRLQGLLLSKTLDFHMLVGLAGAAEAGTGSLSNGIDSGDSEDEANDPDGAVGGGHCFAALRYRKDSGAGAGKAGAPGAERGLHVEIMEGTTLMKKVEVTHSTPMFSVVTRCSSESAQAGHLAMGKNETLFPLALDQFLQYLGSKVMTMSQISNTVLGMAEFLGCNGWAGPNDLGGYLRTTSVMNHLHCLTDAREGCKNLKFYNWIMYTGWQCDQGGTGCLPVNEKPCGRTVGCRPENLGSTDLRAFSTGLSPENLELGRQIFDEAMPPIASQRTLNEYCLDHFEPLRSLGDINQDLHEDSRPGVRYETTCCMEAPADPRFRDLYFTAKATLVDRTNQINEAAPDSDGILGRVKKFGNDVTIMLRVPVEARRDGNVVTFIRSMEQAQAELKWAQI